MKNSIFKSKGCKTISIKVYGKWILAGEYAVLKSCPALVFPLPSQFIKLDYQKDESLDVVRILENEDDNRFNKLKNQNLSEKFSLVSIFESVLNQALQKISKNRSDLNGTIHIHSHIAFGGGIGASAVICVLIGQLFNTLNWLKKEKLFYFCHSLENSLHGQSSGVDIAAVLNGKPILYKLTQDEKNPQIQEFQLSWEPFIFLSWSGESRSTKDNIKKMKLFWEQEVHRAQILNQQMNNAVLKAKEGLETTNKEEGMTFLTESFSLAENCFLQWGLVGIKMKEHILFLKNQGAVATKPTGAGMGGYVLSLWSKQPPVHLRSQLIPVF